MEGTHFDGTYPHIFVTFGASVRRLYCPFKTDHKSNYCLYLFLG